MGCLVLLQTSPRVAAGLLTARAWDVVRDADAVLSDGSAAELEEALSAEGVDVRTVADPVPALLRSCDEGRTAVWLCGDDDRVADAVAAEVVTRAERGDHSLEVEVLAGSYDEPGSRLLDLVEVMDRLRTECPWDREQTHRSLVRYLVEESYETVEAIESGDRDHLREELGDLLLQVMFHSRIAAEDPQDPWTVDDVAADIVEKLVRRHPHVFGDATGVATSAQVLAQWDEIKRAEKAAAGARDRILAGIKPGPALSRAQKVGTRAGKVGFDWPGWEGSFAKVEEEVREVAEAIRGGDAAEIHAELGDLLLAVVNVARKVGVDAENALIDATGRFQRRFEAVEDALTDRGKTPATSTLEEMDALWEDVKRREREP